MSGRALDLCDRVLELVTSVEPGVEAEVNVSDGHASLTRFANSFIHQNVGEDTLSVLVRVVVDGRAASSSTTATDDAGLERLVETTLAAARLRPEDPDWPGLAPEAEIADVDHYDEATEFASPAERAGVVKAFVDAGPELKAAGFCDTEGGTHAFANTAGQRMAATSSRATLDGIHQAGEVLGVAAGKGHVTSQRLSDLDGAAAGAASAQKAIDSVDAANLEPGHYEVVLEPECVAEVLAFLAFYGFNAKQVVEGQSFAVVGDTQFDAAIDLTDDAGDPRAIGTPFDIEGTPKAPLRLVGGGRTSGLVHDRRTARKLDAVSTGHAIPGGESYGAFASNLFLAPGDTSRADLVGSMDRGLLVTEFNYCRVLDPKTLVVTGLTRNGTFLVEDGTVTGAVKNFRFTQSFVEALAPGTVRGVGDDARFAAAEFGVGMVHCPSLHLGSWNFTGGARG